MAELTRCKTHTVVVVDIFSVFLWHNTRVSGAFSTIYIVGVYWENLEQGPKTTTAETCTEQCTSTCGIHVAFKSNFTNQNAKIAHISAQLNRWFCHMMQTSCEWYCMWTVWNEWAILFVFAQMISMTITVSDIYKSNDVKRISRATNANQSDRLSVYQSIYLFIYLSISSL